MHPDYHHDDNDHEWECRWCGAANPDEEACCQYCDGPPTQSDYDTDHRIDERKHSRD